MAPATGNSPFLSFTLSNYLPGLRHAPHRHDELHFSLVLRGCIAETVGRATEYAGALSIVAKDPDVVHADSFGPDGATLARLSLVNGGIGDLLDDARRAAPWGWAHDPAIAAPFLRIVSRAQRKSHVPDLVSAGDADMSDLLAAFTARRCERRPGTPPAWLSKIMEVIRADDHGTWSSTALARHAGVHPVYLARCVRRWYGTGLGMELRKARLRAAVRAVADYDATISAIAHEHGFSDEAHFNRTFRCATGMSPGSYRRALRPYQRSVNPEE